MTLRPARAEDCELAYRWRMDPAVRANSSDPGEFPYELHERWWTARLQDPLTRIWILEDDQTGTPVGQVRYGSENCTACVSISVDARFRGRGYGRRLLLESEALARSELRVDRLLALILPHNSASIAMFVGAGYEAAGTEVKSGRLHYRYEK